MRLEELTATAVEAFRAAPLLARLVQQSAAYLSRSGKGVVATRDIDIRRQTEHRRALAASRRRS